MEAVLDARAFSGTEELLLTPDYIEGWIGFTLLFSFFLSFRLIYHFFFHVKAELLHFHITLKHFEEHNLIGTGLRQVLLLLSAGIIAFAVLVIIKHIDQNTIIVDNLKIYLLILTALIVFYLLKTFITCLLGYLSGIFPYTQIIVYYSQLHIITGSLLLFPLFILLFYKQGPWFDGLLIGIVIVCVSMFLLYLRRCWQTFSVANTPVFFRILYLCTLEFVPFLIIYKYILLN